MKKVFLFAFLALAFNANSQNDRISKFQSNQNALIQIFDSEYFWHFDTTSNNWNKNSRIINMVYDTNHNLLSELCQTWNCIGWDDVIRIFNNYNSQNRIISSTQQQRNDGDWTNEVQYLWTYDAVNNQTTVLQQNWSYGSWVDGLKTTNTYDSRNNLINVLNQSSWNGQNQDQTILTYNSIDSVTNKLFQSWDDNWSDYKQEIFTYNNENRRINEFDQSWYGSYWVNSLKDTLTYDVNNNLTDIKGKYWNETTWINIWQRIETFTYDANNLKNSDVFKYWNSNGNNIMYGDSSYYYFHIVLGLNDLTKDFAKIAIYPNPATDKITIKTSSTHPQSQLSLISPAGQEVLTRQIIQPKTQLDISSLPSGVYIVRLTNDQKVETVKLMKQ